MLSNVDIIEAMKPRSSIRQRDPLVINPLDANAIQPNSVDLNLGDLTVDTYRLLPREFLLAHTMERVEIPDWLAATVWGRSTTARHGVFIHITAGLIDSGFRGNITLELYNASNKVFELRNGMGICQLVFDRLDTPTSKPYGSEGLGSKYQDSQGTVGPKE